MFVFIALLFGALTGNTAIAYSMTFGIAAIFSSIASLAFWVIPATPLRDMDIIQRRSITIQAFICIAVAYILT